MSLLGNKLAHVQKHDQPKLDDWGAVLRSLALHTALPQLRFQGDGLKSALQNNESNGLTPVLNLIFTHNDDSESNQARALVEQIFNVTRMCISPLIWIGRTVGHKSICCGISLC